MVSSQLWGWRSRDGWRSGVVFISSPLCSGIWMSASSKCHSCQALIIVNGFHLLYRSLLHQLLPDKELDLFCMSALHSVHYFSVSTIVYKVKGGDVQSSWPHNHFSVWSDEFKSGNLLLVKCRDMQKCHTMIINWLKIGLERIPTECEKRPDLYKAHFHRSLFCQLVSPQCTSFILTVKP